MLHMLGVIAETGEIFSAQDVADAEVGFKGHGDDHGAAGDARQFAHGGSGVVEMFQDFQAGDGVEGAGGEGQGEHGCADAVGDSDFGQGGGAEIEADGAHGGRQHAAAEHFALARAGVEDGVGIEFGEEGAEAAEESRDDESDDGVGVGVLLLEIGRAHV